MSFQTVAVAIAVIGFGAAQYVLCFQALRDLRRRARVRGNNRVLWALTILCLPIVGPFMYNWMGPTSFRHRPLSSATDLRADEPTNVTPISAAPSARNRSTPASWPDHSRSPRSASSRPNRNRTGS